MLDARLGVWIGAQLAVVAAGVAGSWVGTRLSHYLRDVSPALYLRVAVQYLPLAFLIGAVAFVASSTAHTRGKDLGATVAVTALAYLVNFVARLWHPWRGPSASRRSATTHPFESTNRVNVGNVVLLLAVAVVLIFGAR